MQKKNKLKKNQRELIIFLVSLFMIYCKLSYLLKINENIIFKKEINIILGIF